MESIDCHRMGKDTMKNEAKIGDVFVLEHPEYKNPQTFTVIVNNERQYDKGKYKVNIRNDTFGQRGLECHDYVARRHYEKHIELGYKRVK